MVAFQEFNPPNKNTGILISTAFAAFFWLGDNLEKTKKVRAMDELAGFSRLVVKQII